MVELVKKSHTVTVDSVHIKLTRPEAYFLLSLFGKRSTKDNKNLLAYIKGCRADAEKELYPEYLKENNPPTDVELAEAFASLDGMYFKLQDVLGIKKGY